MATEEERRRHSRFTIPVVIDAPDLSGVSLVPEDVSAGGFRVVVSKRPEAGQEVSCAIQILDESFRDCRGTVVRVEERPETPGTWSIGLRVEAAEGAAGLLEKKLRELSVRLGEG